MAINLDAIRNKLDQLNGAKTANKPSFNKPKKFPIGEHKVRVLPWPDAGDGMPFHERAFYFGIGGGMLVSPESVGKPDPIGEFRMKLFTDAKESGDESLKTLAKKLFPKRHVLVAVVDRANESAGPQLWAVSHNEAKQLLGFFLDDEIGDFTDLKTGRDVKLSVTDSGKRFNGNIVNETIVKASVNVSPASTDENIKKWMANLPKIEDYYPIPEYSEVKEKLQVWLDSDNAKVDEAKTEEAQKTSDKSEEVATAAPKKAAKKSSPAKETEDALDAALADLDG